MPSKSPEKATFLRELQQCIDQYQPMIEKEFGVSLGAVTCREYRIGRFIDEVMEDAYSKWQIKWIGRHGTPPNFARRLGFRVLGRVSKYVCYPVIRARQMGFVFAMRWTQRHNCIEVTFADWSRHDYQNNIKKLDQHTVHELAHGVWDAMVEEDENREGDWRLWSEGFAHYVADIHFRDRYPPTAEINDDWSEFRLRGRSLVERVVNDNGCAILMEIPVRWRELSERYARE